VNLDLWPGLRQVPGCQHSAAILTCRDWNSKSRTCSRTWAVYHFTYLIFYVNNDVHKHDGVTDVECKSWIHSRKLYKCCTNWANSLEFELNASEEDKNHAWHRISDLFGVKNSELSNLSWRINNHQSAYRPRHSTVTSLLASLNTIYRASDSVLRLCLCLWTLALPLTLSIITH